MSKTYKHNLQLGCYVANFHYINGCFICHIWKHKQRSLPYIIPLWVLLVMSSFPTGQCCLRCGWHVKNPALFVQGPVDASARDEKSWGNPAFLGINSDIVPNAVAHILFGWLWASQAETVARRSELQCEQQLFQGLLGILGSYFWHRPNTFTKCATNMMGWGKIYSIWFLKRELSPKPYVWMKFV
jgi:hypothetical protein